MQCCVKAPTPSGDLTLGTDVSQLTSVSSYSCMTQAGYSFTVVRAYESGGAVDPHAVASIANAWAGGQTSVDAYIFPCVASCNGSPSPAAQIQATVNNLRGSDYGMLWLDIEGPQYWYSSASQNVAFIQAMVNECNAQGISCGIYTSNSQWSPITGGSTAFNSLPLWYPHVSCFISVFVS